MENFSFFCFITTLCNLFKQAGNKKVIMTCHLKIRISYTFILLCYFTEVVSAETGKFQDCSTLFVTWHLVPDPDDITARYHHKKPEEITTRVNHFRGSFSRSTSQAINWLLGKDAEHPLLYSTLELATSKEEFMEDLYGVIKSS